MLGHLRKRWGDDIETDGIADRNAIGSRVFSDPEELAWLESQVHPLVQSEISGWFASVPAETRFAVVEVPLLFEGGMSDRFDKTVAIVASEATRSERARGRGQVGIEGREARQLSQDEKAVRADFVIDNDGTRDELQQRLATLLQGLGTRSGLGANGPTDRRV